MRTGDTLCYREAAMRNMSPSASRLPALVVLLGCAWLAGCESRTEVAATGNTAAQFTHVFLTVNQIWFNSSASAAPTDSSWQKFTLSTPQTVDLVNLTNGTLSQVASNLNVPAGTYAQMMLVLADSTDALTTSAQSAGAASNDQVDYIDALNLAHTAPLAILNAAQGITIATHLTVAASSTTLGGSTDTASSTTTTGSTTTDTSSDASIIGTSTTTGTTTATTATPGVTISSFIVDFDATRDLVPVSLSGQPAYLLNPHPQAQDVKYSGTIQGAVDLSAVSTLTTADLPDVQVSAESLSSDGTRHVITLTTRVGADGTFSLYPLSTASGAATSYDLVDPRTDHCYRDHQIRAGDQCRPGRRERAVGHARTDHGKPLPGQRQPRLTRRPEHFPGRFLPDPAAERRGPVCGGNARRGSDQRTLCHRPGTLGRQRSIRHVRRRRHH